MNATIEDLRPTIIPKSDQLNAEQLLGGPVTVTVTEVGIGAGEEQPVVIHYEGEDGRPFKPCKTMRKVLIHAWGPDGRQWAGRSMTLYNDPAVRFGGEDVGGIRISHLSDIDRDVKVSLTSTRGKKAKYEIRRLPNLSAERLAGPISSVAGAASMDELRARFESAYKTARSKSERDQLTAAKNRRKQELLAPAADKPAARSYASIAEAIKTAASAEDAALELDAARDELPPEQIDELGAVYRAKWGGK